MATSEPAQSIRRVVIRRARALDYTAHRLAVESGVGRSQVYRYFRGEADLTSRRLDRLFRVLDLAVYPVRHSPPRPAVPLAGRPASGTVWFPSRRSWRGPAGALCGRGPRGAYDRRRSLTH